jgi:tRNA threonylcarbamoyladenosine biosynthesis protein TsaE
MQAIAAQIRDLYPQEKIYLLKGDLGSGKTTFVKAFTKMLGMEEEVSSPTFSIVHEYGDTNNRIYHFDLYRITNEQELYQIGFEEYIEQNALIFIEWPDLAINFLPAHYLSLGFSVEDKNTRRIDCHIVNNS